MLLLGSADFSLKQLSNEIEKEGGLINEEGHLEEEEQIIPEVGIKKGIK